MKFEVIFQTNEKETKKRKEKGRNRKRAKNPGIYISIRKQKEIDKEGGEYRSIYTHI